MLKKIIDCYLIIIYDFVYLIVFIKDHNKVKILYNIIK